VSPAASFGGGPARRWQIACAVCAAALVAVSFGYAWPLRRETSQLRDAAQALDDREREARTALEDARASLARAQTRLAQLEEETRDGEAIAGDVRRRQEKLERVLSTQFGRLARADMLLVSSAGDRLSIALAIPALFPLGRTQVTPNGRALLCELAQTILQHHDGQLRVSGYYGRPAIAEPALARYGSPWQLSAARAASAAAVLERDCEVAAERVYAVAYGPRAPGPLGENVALELVLSQRD
jgi:chemotaxis protein MotB